MTTFRNIQPRAAARRASLLKLARSMALGFSFSGLVAGAAPTSVQPLPELINATVATAAKQYQWMLAHQPVQTQMPRSAEKGKIITVKARDWTSGFFPGSLWYLYEATGDQSWRSAAERSTDLLKDQQFNKGTHDVGFILNCSYGNGYRLTKNPAYLSVLLNGSASLSTRFSSKVGAIRSWDKEPKGFVWPVIIDNMMNLELLLWTARHGGNANEHAIALTHADTTLRNHFRADHSTFHVVDYDPATGQPARHITHQGIADSSTWARGQSWGLYGYTVMYRETKEPRYLQQAEKIATFLMNHPRLPADKIPFWDFDAPGQPKIPRDASAAAIMCSALFELSQLTNNSANASAYRAFAEAQLRSLCSSAYLAQPGENSGFILMHSTGNHPKNSEIDAPLNYADYYFLEALLRARALVQPKS